MKRMTSIVILSYNTRKLLEDCIESIRRYTLPGTYEIIVVDNASQDDSVVWLQQQKDITLLENAENRGFPGGCNQGLQVAQGTEMLLLNSDTLVTRHWLDNMLRALYSDKCIGAVSCLTNRCGNGQEIKTYYTRAEEMQVFAAEFNISDKSKWKQWSKLVGFCFLFKREVFAQIGFMDETFSPGNYEDDDYSLRIRLAGYELLLCKDTFIHHYGSASFLQDKTTILQKKVENYNAILQRNRVYFLQKWQLNESNGKHHTIIDDMVKKFKTNTRLLIFDIEGANDLFLLNDQRPDLQLVGISTLKTAAWSMEPSFSVIYDGDLVKALQKTDDDFDSVVIVNPLDDGIIDDEILQCCVNKLKNRQGTLYFSRGAQVFTCEYAELANN